MAARDNVTLRFYPEELAPVKKLAKEENRSEAQMLRILISEAVAARAKRVQR